MSKKASNFQKKAMSRIYKGKQIFKPLNTGWIDDRVACVREWIANIFFYTKNGQTIMIDAGYNYDRLAEKMAWLDIDPSSKVEAILCPGHTFGHMVYLVDDEYLFTGDMIWFGADGGYSFINGLAEDNDLAALEARLRTRGLTPKIITGHKGWTQDLDFAFRHRTELCNPFKKLAVDDPAAPYDGYIEDDDTEEKARTLRLAPQIDWTPGK